MLGMQQVLIKYTLIVWRNNKKLAAIMKGGKKKEIERKKKEMKRVSQGDKRKEGVWDDREN